MKLADTIAVLLRPGPRTAGDLAAATGTRPASVRAVLNGMQRHREVEPGDVIRTGRRGRPGRGWRLLRDVLELPFPKPSPPAAEASPETHQADARVTLAGLLEGDRRLEDMDRRALLALAERARTQAELRELLKVRTVRAARELLSRLERRGLVQVVSTRRRTPAAEQLWELHPLFLTRFDVEPDHWRS